MLGLVTPREWLWLGIIVGLLTFGVYERVHLINEGEAKCLTRERAAAAKQAVEDSQVAGDSIDALKREISRLRSAPAPGATPPVRVQCYSRRVPAAASVTGAARPGEPAAAARGVPEVPSGPRGGIDVGASLQRFAFAADTVSAFDRACLKELREP